MKTSRYIIGIFILSLIMASFSNCSTAQKLQENTDFTIGEVTSQGWVAGVEGGGGGINVFVPVSNMKDNTSLEGLYYNGKYVNLEKKGDLFIGRFDTGVNKPKDDLILDGDIKKEYGNKVPDVQEKIPFELAKDEAVLSYKQGGKLRYYKIKNIKNKPTQYNYSTPKKGDDELQIKQ